MLQLIRKYYIVQSVPLGFTKNDRRLKNFHFRERTTMISILSGVGMAFFPLADFLSGQIFQVFVNFVKKRKSFFKLFFVANFRLVDIMPSMVYHLDLQ